MTIPYAEGNTISSIANRMLIIKIRSGEKSWSESVVLICDTTSSFSTKAASCKLSPWTVNTDVDEHDWCSCALRRGCALCLPAAVVGWRQSSHKVRTNWSCGGASPSTNPHISVTWWLADLGFRLTVIFRAFRNILMITSKLTKRIKERSIREGLLKKNCCSFGFYPNYLPLIWTTCTTFFRRQNSRSEIYMNKLKPEMGKSKVILVVIIWSQSWF